jgi:hypothetical protein
MPRRGASSRNFRTAARRRDDPIYWEHAFRRPAPGCFRLLDRRPISAWFPAFRNSTRSFVILAMAASAEAIFLSTSVLISQNRMAAAADKPTISISRSTCCPSTRLRSLWRSCRPSPIRSSFAGGCTDHTVFYFLYEAQANNKTRRVLVADKQNNSPNEGEGNKRRRVNTTKRSSVLPNQARLRERRARLRKPSAVPTRGPCSRLRRLASAMAQVKILLKKQK